MVLRSMGYSVSFATLDSSFFGIPQQRKRLYIVGFHQDTNNAFSFTRKRTESIPFRPFIEYGDYSIPISNKWQEYIDLYTGRKNLDQISFSVPKRAFKNYTGTVCEIFLLRSFDLYGWVLSGLG